MLMGFSHRHSSFLTQTAAMKFLSYLLMLCLFHSTIIAQKNFDPGYIINHNRDTVKGFIETTEEKKLSSSVRFRKETSGELQEYNPGDLFGFGIGQVLYKSFIFNNTVSGSRMDTVFARQLVSGEYNLFTFVTSDRFFLLQKDTSLYLLYDESQDGSGTIDRVGNFRNYLNFISVPCENLKDKYKGIGYSENSLADFVQKTNNCISGGSSRIYGQKQKLEITPIIFAGGLPLSGQNAYFTGNLSLRFTLPRVDKKLSLNIGVNYTNTTYMTAASEALNPYYHYYTKEEIFSIPLTIQYNVLLTRVQPYFFLGCSFAQNKTDNLGTGFWIEPDNKYNSLNIIAGLGVEARVAYGFYIRGEYRFEALIKYPAIGLSYHF